MLNHMLDELLAVYGVHLYVDVARYSGMVVVFADDNHSSAATYRIPADRYNAQKLWACLQSFARWTRRKSRNVG